MGLNPAHPGNVKVIFHYDERTEEKTLNVAQITALLGSDLVFIDEYKEPKKIDKKTWASNVIGMSLHVNLK
jgi:hypothetical protein